MITSGSAAAAASPGFFMAAAAACPGFFTQEEQRATAAVAYTNQLSRYSLTHPTKESVQNN
jgi:hypothetical protein